MHAILHKRRRICCINLELAFPELSTAERDQLNREHFISLGRGVFETTLSWWGKQNKINSLAHFEGEEYLQQALAEKKGVVLLSAHFTSLEMGGRILSAKTPLHVVYRRHQNALIEALVAKMRERRYGKAIPKDNIRDMIRSLKQGFPVWYAQDQSFRDKRSIDVPFFGTKASTNTGTSRIAGMTQAKIVPFFTVRVQGSREGYLLRFLPALDNFPSGDIENDTLRINQLIEEQVREFPAQYLWTHKRYKSKTTDFYSHYLEQHPDSHCQ